MAEHVELPRGGRGRAQDVALETHAVHEVPDRRLGAREVGVGFVVGPAHDLDTTRGDEPAQVGTVLGMGVPVRFEVVDLGQHELVFRFPARHFEMRTHQVEAVGLPALPGRVLGPHTGVGGLGVPPHRVVVEVADHVHRPAGFGHREIETETRGVCTPDLAGHWPFDVHRHLDHTVPGIDPRRTRDAVALDRDDGRLRAPPVGHRHQLTWLLGRSGVPLRRLRGCDVHLKTLRRHSAMSTTSARWSEIGRHGALHDSTSSM